jgi:hypothetical protein
MVRNLGDNTRVLRIEISRTSKETNKRKGIPANLLCCRERVRIREGNKYTPHRFLTIYSTESASGLKSVKGEFYVNSISV